MNTKTGPYLLSDPAAAPACPGPGPRRNTLAMMTGQDFGPSSTFEKSRPNIVPGPGRIAIPPRLTPELDSVRSRGHRR